MKYSVYDIDIDEIPANNNFLDLIFYSLRLE